MMLIDADELKCRLKALNPKIFCDKQQAVNACIAEVLAMPTVDAEPVIHAHWEHLDAVDDIERYECSNCKTWHVGKMPHFEFMQMFSYCPHCGAKMDEPKEV